MAKTKRTSAPKLGKRILCAVLAVALVIGLCYAGFYLLHYTFYNAYRDYLSSYEYEQGTELSTGAALDGAPSYLLVSQTQQLAMYLDRDTSDIAIVDKRTGHVTFAVPQDAQSDSIANDVNKNYLRSHLIVNYYTPNRTEGVYDSYSMAVEREQVSYESIEGGVRVIYELGDFSNSTGMVPMYMSEEKFEALCALLSEEDAKSLGRYYSTNSDVGGMRQLLKTARSNRIVLRRIEAMLQSAGFTEEDYAEQMELAGSSVSVPISFVIALEYRLEGDHVDVSVPTCAIEENGGGAIFKLQLLRNFGAADDTQEGYLVVPNADGSLIYFNNGKTGAANYTQYIYGIDPLDADYTVTENADNATMALFGICAQDSTILATIEDGAALAAVTAGVAGKINSYNYVYTTFVLRGSEKLEMFGTTGNEATLPIVEDELYDCNLTVRYSFLDDAHTGYSGIANYYRQRLLDEGVLTVQQPRESIKFYYDVIAGVEMTEHFLGKQYMSLTAMTTFEQAGQMSQQLSQAGITSQVMNLQGWFNSGYYHDAANHIFVNRKLGGKKGLEQLNALLAESGGTLYADVAFQKVSFESADIWFNYQAESSKYYGSGYVANFGQVNPVTLRQTSSLGYSETLYDLISPKFLVRNVQTFAQKLENYDISGISLRDLGNTLQSDKKRSNVIHREQALDVVKAQLQALAETDRALLLNAANDYAWSVSTDLINLPLDDNAYILVDENIPLYEMIVHGCVDYCGSAYNLTDTDDTQRLLLTMLEYGASPHFVFTWQPSSDMKYSGLNGSYCTTFSTWVDTAAEVYDQVDRVLSRVSGATITQHRIVASGVRAVTYSNGVTIYVNYNSSDVTVQGITIPAMGYQIV